jgi:hypothetical protein
VTATITQKTIERIRKLQEHHGTRISWVLTGLSFLWGLASGVLLKRDYEHSRTLLSYLGLFVLISVIFRIFVEYEARLAARAQTPRGLRGLLVKKPALVSGVANFGTQYAAQYITMFCIPLLFLARAWFTLGLTVILAAICLVDPWWNRVSTLAWCMSLIRAFSGVIAVAFAFPVLMPQYLQYFYPVLAATAVLATLPWDLVMGWQRRRLQHAWPPLLAICLIVAEIFMHSRLRLPLLSIWLKDQAMGVDINAYKLSETWSQDEDQGKLTAARDAGQSICCYTPIVSPSGVASMVSHEWLINDQVVDRILLSPIRSPEPNAQGVRQHNERGFRTYSCKKHIPDPSNVRALTCRVYLEESLFVGETQVRFKEP